MLSKEKIEQIISEVGAMFPGCLNEKTPKTVITGEYVAKRILMELWGDDSFSPTKESRVDVFHFYVNGAPVKNQEKPAEPEEDFTPDDVLLNKDMEHLNFIMNVTHDRNSTQYDKHDDAKFSITHEPEVALVTLQHQEVKAYNKFYMQPSPQLIPKSIELLLQTFRINAYQVLIDVSAKEIHFTPEFEEFVKTKQLLVTWLKQPNFTLLDLVIAANTIPCYCDLEQEMLMIAQAVYYKVTTPSIENTEISYEAYQRAYNVFPNMHKYFSYDKTTSSVVPKETLPKEERLLAMASDNLDFILSYWQLYKRTSVGKAVREKIDALFPFSYQRYCLLSKGTKYFDLKREPATSVEMRHLNDMVTKHVNLNKIIGHLNVYDQISFCETIRDFVHKYDEWVIGVLETNQSSYMEGGVIDYKKISDLLEKHISDLNAPLIEVLDLREFKYRANVEELSTTLELQVEGKKMHHCVGGYSNNVKNGQSRIFHIETEGAGNKSTLELGVTGTNQGRFSFSERQHKSIQNAEPQSENRNIARELVQFLNKKFN